MKLDKFVQAPAEVYLNLQKIGSGRSTWSLHTAKNMSENLHIKGFDLAGRPATRVIEKLSGIL
jgi:hypothetical protein